ncbi:MAG: hypothetical protein HKN23_01630 [Verrucomicrobiales bacterium]|nr:hypothetical protein [Verrucomicrobiales bacterium]
MLLTEETIRDDQIARRKLISLFTALGICGGMLLILTLVTVFVPQQDEVEILAKVVPKSADEKPRMKKIEPQKLAKQATSSSSPSSAARIIQANAVAVISMPKVNVQTASPLGLGEGNFGDGFGNGRGNGMGSAGVGSMKGVGKKIQGMTVKAEKLGVVLDVSGSMSSYLEELRKDIKKEFEDAAFREAGGCRLDNAGPVIGAMQDLIVNEKVDAIFWFCDLNDGETDEGLAMLEELLYGGKAPPKIAKSEFGGLDELKQLQERAAMEMEENEPVKLYVRSVGHNAKTPLKRLIRSSGGSFKKQR